MSLSRFPSLFRLKRFRSRFGITAPRVVVRSHVPWPWPVAIGLLLALLVGIFSWSLAQRNEAGMLGRERDDFRARVVQQEEQLEALRSLVGTAPNEASLAKAAQQKLLDRIRELEKEASSLREDVRLYERLVPVVGDQGQLRVDKFNVSSEERGVYRYHLQALYLPGRLNQVFKGVLQLQVAYVVNGVRQDMLLPPGDGGADNGLIEIRRVFRHEGWFRLPDGAILKELEGRVLQNGSLKMRFVAEL